jgi:YVTN family beta-propeller protein
MTLLRYRVACAVALNCLWSLAAALAADPLPSAVESATEQVGRYGTNEAVLPVNQRLTPYGRFVDLPGLRPQALALSPNGRVLVASGKTSEILVLDPVTGAVKQRVPLPGKAQEPQPGVVSPNILKPEKDAQVSFTGLAFAPDGRRLYLANVNGSVKVFSISAAGVVSGADSWALPAANAPRRKEEIASGMAVSPDGRRIYVCGNLSNQLFELDATTGAVLRAFPVGVAPYGVVLVRGKAYVSNWGGRRPGAGDLTGPAGRGTTVRVDPVRHIASEGSVTVLDLSPTAKPRQPLAEILTGMHASALAVSPNQRHVVVANANSDTLSVIDTRTDRVVETIWAKTTPSDLFGASPNALAFAPNGRTLYVANGTQNAVAVLSFDPQERESRLTGLIPVGWFPGALAFDRARQQIIVANLKGHPLLPKPPGDQGGAGFNSHQYAGSLSLVPLPARRELPALSERVARNLRAEAIAQSRLPARPGQPARAIPERIGEPSLIKHVVYVIKENRTYDQVLGDDPRGKGDPRLCIFGEQITPNQHKLVREFVLLDNTYCAGILSADGHQWSTTAFATDYMEKSFAGFPRSYPDGMGEDEDDALAYSAGGFLWDNAVKHGKTIRNYGEFAAPYVKWRDPKRKGSPGFRDCYRQWKGESDEVLFASYPMVESLRGFMPTNYVGWEMDVPDQYRADFILRELREFEARGEFPQLVIICLPNDHTSGTSKDEPTPAACVADNDLAFGRIVEALSRSRFWPELAVFAIEDDPQAGWDHISGYRTTAYVASPYAKRGVVLSTQYNTTSLIRTMEQILGLPPMTQFDASATPMFDAFSDTPDFTPFAAVPANVPLDQMNPDPKTIQNAVLRQDALACARMNFKRVDACPEDQLNRILWRAMRGTSDPYPEWAVTSVSEEEEEEEERGRP